MYSASFGEQALESLIRNDSGRNSLFTEVLRTELLRPGQSLIELADRVKLMVRAIAQDFRSQQEPEIVENAPDASTSCWSARSAVSASACRRTLRRRQGRLGADQAPAQARTLRAAPPPLRRLRHCRACAARDRAARTVVGRSDRTAAGVANRGVSECDRLAASELDLARPPEVPGVPFEKMDAQAAIAACPRRSRTIRASSRYLFNLGRAYHKARHRRRASTPLSARARCAAPASPTTTRASAAMSAR